MSHYADLFMNQRLCHLSQLPKYFCTMQSLLYKVTDPSNTAYLRKYLSSLPGKILDLVKSRFEDLDIDIETLSLAGLQEQIITALQQEWMKRKTAKSLKKHLGFDTAVCEVFKETTSFGCTHQKSKPRKGTHKDCDCHNTRKSFPRKPSRRFSVPRRKFFFKRRSQHAKAKSATCFICKKPGHWANQCPLRSKTKVQTKIMDLFLTGYDPAEWDLVSNRSDGEYLSLTEDTDSSLDIDPTPLDHHSSANNSDSDFSTLEESLNFLDIKMMSSFVDLQSLLSQRSTLEQKISALSPGQFHLSDKYASQLGSVTAQIDALQQPSVVNIHHYTPPDAEFVRPKPIPSSIGKGKELISYSSPPKDEESIDSTIFHLEEEVREKEALIKSLWKTLKLQKEEVEYLKNKRDEEMEQEIFYKESEVECLESNIVKGLDDRLVITVNIKVKGYLQYSLDA